MLEHVLGSIRAVFKGNVAKHDTAVGHFAHGSGSVGRLDKRTFVEHPRDALHAGECEEVGTRGAFGAAFSVAPETALVLETTTAADLPGVEGHRRVCAPGRGPVISYMDGGTIYDRGLFEDLRRLAEDNGIPWQTKEYIAGGNDARTIQRSRAGVRVAALSAAVRYLHAPASVGSLADFEDMLALTRLFVADQAARL